MQEQKSRIADCKKILLARFKDCISEQFSENENFRFTVSQTLNQKKLDDERDRINRAVQEAAANAEPAVPRGLLRYFVA